MNTCETCKHWTNYKEDEHDRADGLTDPHGFDADHNYIRLPTTFEVRHCRSPLLLQYERPTERRQAATVDGSEYWSSLVTGPDFGCVNHEPDGPLLDITDLRGLGKELWAGESVRRETEQGDEA